MEKSGKGDRKVSIVRAALVGAWHVHFNQYAKEFSSREDCRITALWDDEPSRGSACAAEYGCPFEPDYDRLLSRNDVDAVIVCSATSQHRELIEAAARAGKHIYTEKVLAFTLEEARSIAAVVEKAGVKFCISYPWMCRDFVQGGKRLIDSGALGEITYVRMRNCHNGAVAGWLPAYFYDPVLCGGGAMMDLGAHSMYLMDYFLGLPAAVTSIFTKVTDKAVEDNAVTLLEYANGAIGSAETGFVSTNDPYSIEIAGTKGVFLSGGPENRTLVNLDGQWKEAALPPSLPKPMDLWVDGILQGTPIPSDIQAAVRLSQLMEAAYRSAAEGKRIALSK